MARIRGYVPYKIQRALNGGRGGLLSHTEEADLGPGAQSGDGEARRQFLENNLRLAV
jgi:hypothetical protein